MIRHTQNRISPPGRQNILEQLQSKVLWLSAWMIHNANHLRTNEDGLKVGGHQASCASMVSIMTALYFSMLRPEDRVAVKPHAAPVFHAIQYLLGNQSLDKLENFRGFGGAQSYPSRTKDTDDVDFSTGSVGLGAAMTAFASMIQDYIQAKAWSRGPRPGRMIALVGDAELDEGNVYECLLEGWKHGLRNTWWVIDYNRQSLDGIVHEGLYSRIEKTFAAFDWEVITLKYGALQRAAFAEPGGAALRNWIDDCPNPLYSALTYQGGAAWRARLNADLRDNPDTLKLLARRSDGQLAELMGNLGGHCLPTLIETFSSIDHDRPVCFIAYTIKGWGLPLAGHKDNHAGILTPEQMAGFQKDMGIRPGHEWEPLEGIDIPAAQFDAFLDAVPFNTGRSRRTSADPVYIPALPEVTARSTSTQEGFGKILNDIGRSDAPYADRIVTMSPDVSVSTNLGPWINQRNLFGAETISDTFRDEKVISGQKWSFDPAGQHIELGIAENNLFLGLAAAGLSHSLFGERLLPIGTLYDPFIARGLDALNYACYQDARFLLVATPSGVTLAPEGGAHQSIGTPLIGMAQDGLATFEPAYVDELRVIMGWSFDYMQRDGTGEPDPSTWLRDHTGGSVYLRCSTRRLEQPARELSVNQEDDIVNGAYWLREPGPNCELVIAYQGVVAPEAQTAAGMAAEHFRDIAVLAVTSADRLNAGWQSAQRARRHDEERAESHVERLMSAIPGHAHLLTLHDAHPAALSWLGGVRGLKTSALGVEHFGQTGTIDDLYAHFEINCDAVLRAATADRKRSWKRHQEGVSP